ncbi:MAG TPA: helix-turn-helix domain-containing protein [Pseudonocardia sp.]|nr:helix-turn-helix domain-containing protein [Pseudonocardia sp.]
MSAALPDEGAPEQVPESSAGGAAAVPPKRRRRRSSAAVRELITGAARDLFAKRGYAATTTRDVALEAGVDEATIYRHFGSKAKLFETAVGEPYRRFMADYMGSWTEDTLGPKTGEEVVAEFAVGLYEALSANRDLILAYILAEKFEAPELNLSGGGEGVVSRELRAMDEWSRRTCERLDFHDVDDPVTLRCSFAMVMGLVLHDELLFEQGAKHPSKARVLRELSTYMYRALATRRVEL